MATFKPRIRPTQHFTITNAVELAPLPELVSQFISAECVTPHTLKAYSAGLKQFLEFATVSSRKRTGHLSYSDVTKALLSDYRKHKLETGAQNTAAQRLDIVKSFTSWMRKRYGVDDPGERVKAIPHAEHDFRGLTPAEVKTMLAACKLERDPVRRFLPSFLLYTGTRIDCEALQTRMGQLDLEALTLRSVLGKGAKLRHVPIDPAGIPEFTHYLSWREQFPHGRDSLLFPAPRGSKEAISYWTGLRIVQRYGFTPHQLRHSYAYRFLDRSQAEGDDAFRAAIKLRKALGHGSINTTLIYLGIQPGDLERRYGLEELR